MLRRFLVWFFCFVAVANFTPTIFAAGKAKYFVLVVWDGMRPDFVSPELTPTLSALRNEGVWFANHHSAYPTSTEVNGTVLATGAFPQRNGISANREYRKEIDPLKSYDTQSLRAVRRGDEVTGGKYITVPTLAETLHSHGFKTAVAGAKAVVLLQDRKARSNDAPGLIWFADGCMPESRLNSLTNRLGRFPAAASPNAPRDEWVTRCLTEEFWAGDIPRYSVLWLSEPDNSQHRIGIGSPEALEAIRNCDRQLATLLRELERRGVRDQTDVVLVSDHGFSTISDSADTAAALRATGINARSSWEQPPVNGDVVVVGNGGSVMIYVIGHSTNVIQKIVTNLQHQPSTGAMFTRDGLPGTFPLAEAGIATPTAPDVVVSMRWTLQPQTDTHAVSKIFRDGYNQYEKGMHVTLSPTDLHNTGVACGPDFRRGVTNALPSGNVDIVPTFLWLMGIESSAPLDGRVLSEALTVDGPPVHATEPGHHDARVKLPDGVWEQYLKFTEVNGVRYLDEGNGRWIPAATK